MPDIPRITFGMIVLNGEPFVLPNLRALYPFAHQIIVVEGASPAARDVSTADGHSRDGTLETLRRFKENGDPEGRLTIVTAEDEGHGDGFWPGEKDEQSQAYAKRADGDYLWQVDVDEFYRTDDMRAVIDMLAADPSITAVSFTQITFWGGFDYTCDGWYLRSGAGTYHRLFKWGPGYGYVTHRPPTVRDEKGRDLRKLNWIRPRGMTGTTVRLYHYSLVFPRQVADKCAYYGSAQWAGRGGAEAWAEDVFMALKRPYRVHNIYTEPSWLERYEGEHPETIERLRADIRDGRVEVEARPNADVKRLLDSVAYRIGRGFLKLLFWPIRILRLAWCAVRCLLGAVSVKSAWSRSQ